ncbi:MAG: acetolactate synthase large subunit [Thermosediminibacterales bacterium]|nr:acetolactate synthase large subunit [Thermosediminibacterales bacterium]
MSGDGSFLFNSQELSTAVKLGIDLLILLFNDGRYGSVRVNQIRTFGRSSGTDLCNPDFIKLADAYGVHGVRVEQISDFKDIYGDLINKKGVRLIEIPSEFLDSY